MAESNKFSFYESPESGRVFLASSMDEVEISSIEVSKESELNEFIEVVEEERIELGSVVFSSAASQGNDDEGVVPTVTDPCKDSVVDNADQISDIQQRNNESTMAEEEAFSDCVSMVTEEPSKNNDPTSDKEPDALVAEEERNDVDVVAPEEENRPCDDESIEINQKEATGQTDMITEISTSASNLSISRTLTSANSGESSLPSVERTPSLEKGVFRIDNLRTLLQNELTRDSELIAKLTGRLRALEKDMVAKNKTIKASSALINDLKNRNGDYARELSILSQTVDELVDSKRESMGKIAELEMDIAVKNESVKQLANEVVEHQKIIKHKDNKISSLAQEIDTIQAQKHGLENSIDELRARNDDYASEFENLLSSLKDLVDQNAVLEFHVKELQGKNASLTETVSGLTSSLEDVKNKYQNEVCTNEILMSENEEIKNSVLRMMDDHKHTIGYWENQLQCEPTIE